MKKIFLTFSLIFFSFQLHAADTLRKGDKHFPNGNILNILESDFKNYDDFYIRICESRNFHGLKYDVFFEENGIKSSLITYYIRHIKTNTPFEVQREILRRLRNSGAQVDRECLDQLREYLEVEMFYYDQKGLPYRAIIDALLDEIGERPLDIPTDAVSFEWSTEKGTRRGAVKPFFFSHGLIQTFFGLVVYMLPEDENKSPECVILKPYAASLFLRLLKGTLTSKSLIQGLLLCTDMKHTALLDSSNLAFLARHFFKRNSEINIADGDIKALTSPLYSTQLTPDQPQSLLKHMGLLPVQPKQVEESLAKANYFHDYNVHLDFDEDGQMHLTWLYTEDNAGERGSDTYTISNPLAQYYACAVMLGVVDVKNLQRRFSDLIDDSKKESDFLKFIMNPYHDKLSRTDNKPKAVGKKFIKLTKKFDARKRNGNQRDMLRAPFRGFHSVAAFGFKLPFATGLLAGLGAFQKRNYTSLIDASQYRPWEYRIQSRKWSNPKGARWGMLARSTAPRGSGGLRLLRLLK